MLGTIILLVIVECLLGLMASYALEKHAGRPVASRVAGQRVTRGRP